MKATIVCEYVRSASGQGFLKFVGAILLQCLAACTTLPTQEFAAYKDAFAKARLAGEEVLIDHAAARAQTEQLQTKRKLAAKPKPPPRVVPFDPEAIMLAGQAVDHVAVRFRAWEVVAKYNEALTRLAEGQSGEQVASAVGGLIQSLSDFPLDQVKDLVTDISPFIAPLKVLVAAAEKERSRQEFLAVLARGAPLINGRFIKLLRDDTANFYNIKQGLNDLQYDPIIDQLAAEADRCKKLADVHRGETEEMKSLLNGLLTEINVALVKLPVVSGGTSPVKAVKYDGTPTAAPYTPLAHSALQQCKDNVNGLVVRALEKHAELGAYADVLKAYLVLLDKITGSLNLVVEAAEKKTPIAPPSKELLTAFITLRQTFLNYKDKE